MNYIYCWMLCPVNVTHSFYVMSSLLLLCLVSPPCSGTLQDRHVRLNGILLSLLMVACVAYNNGLFTSALVSY